MRLICLFALFTASLLLVGNTFGQTQQATLQPGVGIERTIAPGQFHTFTLTMEDGQFAQIVVEQKGIDVVVQVQSPARKSLGRFDTPNGSEGPENVSIVAATAGVYNIIVTPLDQTDTTPAGRYEIKLIELRKATEQELNSSNNQEVLKAKGLALLVEVADKIAEIHSPRTRIHAQIRAAQLLWDSDVKLASKFMQDAMNGVREYLSSLEGVDQNYFENYQSAMQLRLEVVQVLAPHDPDAALSFLRSTRSLVRADGQRNRNEMDQETHFELLLASQVAAKDPKRAFQIAEETLKNRYSSGLIQTLLQLRNSDADLATQLAKDIVSKLRDEKLLRSAEATELGIGLLRLGRTPGRVTPNGIATNVSIPPLISDQDYRVMLQKMVAEALAYKPPANNSYSPERNAAQNLLNMLQSMGNELETYIPGASAALQKRTSELASLEPQTFAWRKYQDTINNGSTEASLEVLSQAPLEFRDQLYQQLAEKAAASGDVQRAKQIIQDHISDQYQRQQALNNLDQQAIFRAVGKGKFEEAIRAVGNFRSARARAAILSQIVLQIGPGLKTAAAINLLELTRAMLGTSLQAEDQDQMNAMLQLAAAFGRYDSKRAFEMLDPLVDQLNSLCEAAKTMNGFGQNYYQDGELIMQNGNSVATVAGQLISALSTLSSGDFERARTASDRIGNPEVRLNAYLGIAQQAITGGMERRF